MISTTNAKGENITVRSLKFDGSERRRWNAKIFSIDRSLIIVDAVFDCEVQHDEIGLIKAGTLSREHYWFERWYSIFRFTRPDGKFSCYYCNINLPPVINDEGLSFVDMDIDVLVDSDSSHRILDEEEFKTNAIKYGYPVEIQSACISALEDLLRLLHSRDFPFCAHNGTTWGNSTHGKRDSVKSTGGC